MDCRELNCISMKNLKDPRTRNGDQSSTLVVLLVNVCWISCLASLSGDPFWLSFWRSFLTTLSGNPFCPSSVPKPFWRSIQSILFCCSFWFSFVAFLFASFQGPPSWLSFVTLLCGSLLWLSVLALLVGSSSFLSFAALLFGSPSLPFSESLLCGTPLWFSFYGSPL